MRHANVPIFVPHIGCPHACSFCNQRSISGVQAAPDAAEVLATCRRAAGMLGERVSGAQIAFFGGSFTAIDRAYMLELLTAAREAMQAYGFAGVRVSTRPDCIDPEILELLAGFGVQAIELGVQSLDDRVLAANRRGHSASDVRRAARFIREAGFELGMQMMVGLYQDNREGVLRTARGIADMQPQTVRIYPIVVIKGTQLAALYERGLYTPPTMDEAVALGAALLAFFEGRSVRVIRLGLHASETLEADRVAGIYHPAFRELCEGERYRRVLDGLLAAHPPGGVTLLVPPGHASKVTGQGRCNLLPYEKRGFRLKVCADASVPPFSVRVV